MEHSVTAYLRRLPTEALEDFLLDCKSCQQKEDFLDVIDEVIRELLRRKEEK